MFRRLFHKRRTEKPGRSAGLPPFPASAQIQPPTSTSPASLDDTMLAVSRELSALAQIPVSPAAKERGWAALQREMERHPVRATSPAGARAPRPARARTWRWAIASAAAAVAVIAALLGTYSGGLLQTVDSGDQTTTVTSVVTSNTTEPSTTISTDGTTVTSGVPTSEEQVDPSTTDGSATTSGGVTTDSAPDTTQGGGPVTTGTSGSSGPTTTTRPPSTTTTGEQQYASTQREGSARAAVAYLADLVITGNTSGARALVAAEAQGSLAQMMMSLDEPYGYRITRVQSLSDTIVRVSLEINDRVVDPNGELKEALPRFAIKVRVDDKGAVITAINAG